MTADDERKQNQNQEIQKEIRSGRTFSIAEVIGREGGNFLKGDSPVPRLVQARTEIVIYIKRHLPDHSGALQAILANWVQSDETYVSRHLNAPLQALVEIVESIISNQHMLHEFVRQVDVMWGQMNDERPYFQRAGQAAHPEDEYTHESVHQALTHLLQHVPKGE